MEDYYHKPIRLLCIIDLNQESNMIVAFEKAYTMIYKDGDISILPSADEGS